MPYRLQPSETLPDGLRRIVREQLGEAIEGLRHPPEGDREAAVHGARKNMKKSRAVLRLVRDELGDELYDHENARLRDAGRRLSAIREADVMVETLDAVAAEARALPRAEALSRLRLRLEADRDEARASVLDRSDEAGHVITLLEEAHRGVDAWPLERDEFAVLAPGLRRTYKRGRKRMATAASEPTVMHLHEWRKREKDLWYHARLLECVWPDSMKPLVKATDELGDLLGEDHDLALLHRRAGDHADAMRAAADVEALLELIALRRVELRERALALGRRLYSERPRTFVGRLETWWDTWRDEQRLAAGAANGTARANGRQGRTGRAGAEALETVELADHRGQRAVDGLYGVDLEIGPHEASDLLPVQSEALLEAHGFDLAFWTVLDDTPAEGSLAIIGHQADAVAVAEGWRAKRVGARAPGAKGKTEDAEALACHGGHVYVFGSSFGPKKGPLSPARAFVARFREADVALPLGSAKIELEVVRERFRVHRAVNDALREYGPGLLEIDPSVCKRYVDKAYERGEKKDKAWAGRVLPGDVPLNIEGAAFRPDGKVLLGLRVPTTADGDPILVELASIDPLFESSDELPEVTGFWVLRDLGSPGAPAGIRALRDQGYEVHAITGSLDSAGKDSALLAEHPEGETAHSTHSVFRLPNRRGRVRRIRPTVVRHFPHLRNVEGLAADGHGRFYYVTDEDSHVPIRFAEAALEGLVRDREGPDRVRA